MANHWRSKVDALVLLESPLAGRTTHSRSVGVVKGLEERLGKLPENLIHHLDGGGDKATSKLALSNFLKSTRPSSRILVAGINDESAIGAVEAVNAMKGRNQIAIVGHGGSAEILELIRDPKSPCIGVVSFNAERYGPELFNFTLPIVQGRSAPTGQHVAHKFINRAATR
jgi:ribose transport system substrate-binding protein